MKVVTKNTLDCILFSYRQVKYLLPIVAFAEWGVYGEVEYAHQGEILGTIIWRELTLPLLAPDLSFNHMDLKKIKVAILNAVNSPLHACAFFAILVDDNPIKLKVRASELEWVNKEKRTIIYSKERTLPKELIILDLEKLSLLAQSVTSPKSP